MRLVGLFSVVILMVLIGCSTTPEPVKQTCTYKYDTNNHFEIMSQGPYAQVTQTWNVVDDNRLVPSGFNFICGDVNASVRWNDTNTEFTLFG